MNNRTIYRIPLRPAMSDRFQPTGFPDLGAAVFKSPLSEGGWVESLHVESPQSMAKRLQLTTWDDANQQQVAELQGLPYIEIVNSEGKFLTSSRLEAHRLASAYIMDATHDGSAGRDLLKDWLHIVKDQQLDHRELARGICTLDPVSLIHGVFFAQKKWDRQPKVQRAVTCFIDARDVTPAISGGVKTDVVNSSSGREEGRGSAEGYGSVPHQRVEYTAQDITAFVSIDHAQIRSYGLGDAGEELLEALVDYELAHLFRQDGLRLRTACDLDVVAPEESLDGISTPDEANQRVKSAIAAAGDLLGDVQRFEWAAKKAK